MLRQPRRQRLGVRDAALAKAGVRTDLGAMALCCTAREVKRPELDGGDADLPRQVRHRVVRELVAPLREAPTPQQELEEDRESEPGRTGLVAQLVGLVADQGEMVHDAVETQVTGHVRGRPGRRASRGSSRSAQEASRSRRDVAQARSLTTRPPGSGSPRSTGRSSRQVAATGLSRARTCPRIRCSARCC